MNRERLGFDLKFLEQLQVHSNIERKIWGFSLSRALPTHMCTASHYQHPHQIVHIL